MRIAYFTETYYPQLNGVVTSLNNFSNVYRAQGHTTYIIAPKLKGYKDSDPNIIRIPSLKIWPTFPDLARVPLLLPGGYFRKLLKLDADIVHAHGNGGYSLIGLLFAKLKKIPYVLTFHNLHTVYASLLFKGIVLTPEMVEKFLKNFAENCDLVVTPSYKMELELISYGVKKPIEIIPNFLDLKKFNVWDKHFLHKLLNLPPATPILLAAGRIEPEKNFEFLIKSFHKISKEDQTSHLVIVGEGRVENELRQLAEDLNIKTRVHLPGNINPKDMPYAYADADIFVFASFSEVHPMVTMEAAASGLPLVVVNDKAYQGAVVDGLNGFVVESKTETFAKKILELLRNPKLAKQYGKKSKEVIKQNFGQEYITTKLMDLYVKTITKYKNKS